MDEKDYELLHALDETRNITHAADKLYMTQSALSKRIKALEQELGVASMERALFMLILIRMDIIKDCHGIFMGIIGLSAMV